MPALSLLLATVFSAFLAAALVRVGGAAYTVYFSLPLSVLGMGLVLWNSHWGLCFAAFAIAPFGVVQQEVLGVTLNLPEVLILALAAKEALYLLARRDGWSPAVPWKCLALFVIALAVAVGTGCYRGNGVLKVLQDFRQFSEFIVLFWLVAQRLRDRDQVLQVAVAYVAGATLIAVHGIVQHFVPIGISETQISSDLVLHGAVRSGSFYGATPLGGLMLLAIGPAIGILFAADRRRTQAFLLACIGLCLLALIFTKTRGAWAGMGLSLLFLFAWARPGRRAALRIAALMAVLALATAPLILSRMATLANPAEDNSLLERARYYTAAAHIARAHPALGLGWGCYYEIDAIVNAGEYIVTPRPEEAEDATVHGAYLQIFVKSGALGLAGFLVIMAAWLERLWRVHRSGYRERKNVALLAGLAAGLAGYLFHSTFENFFQWPVMAQSFWLLLGLSFALAAAVGGRRAYPVVPALFTGASVAAFLLFMGLSMRLEGLHPDYYEANVAEAVARGDVEQARRFAQFAAGMRPGDPMAKVVLAEVLFLTGEGDAAREQLDAAIGVTTVRGEYTWSSTDAIYYFAPARLLRGRLLAEAGDYRNAAAEFELARPYADLREGRFAEYHDTLYDTYARLNLWARALEFGAPDSAALEALGEEQRVHLAHAAAGKGTWDLAEGAATRLAAMDDYRAKAHYLLGRMHLDQGDPDAAHADLARAADEGHPDAPYFLGLSLAALDQPAAAMEAFLSTAAGSVFYPLALAHSLALYPEPKGISEPPEIREQLAAVLVAMRPVGGAEDGTPSPAAYRMGATPDGPAALTLLWGSVPAEAAQLTPVAVLPQGSGGWAYQLGDGGAVLQFQWADHGVMEPGLLETGDEAGPLPGWIDTMHDWFQLRDSHTATASRTTSGASSLTVPGLAWFNSVPVALTAERGLLLAGSVRGPAGAARIIAQRIDRDSNVLDTHLLAESTGTDGSATGARYVMPGGDDGSGLRFQVSVARDATAQFDNLALLHIVPPPGHE